MPDFSIHKMCHMVGFLVINNGYLLEVTAKILGHQNIASSNRYAVLDMAKAKNAYNKTIANLLNE